MKHLSELKKKCIFWTSMLQNMKREKNSLKFLFVWIIALNVLKSYNIWWYNCHLGKNVVPKHSQSKKLSVNIITEKGNFIFWSIPLNKYVALSKCCQRMIPYTKTTNKFLILITRNTLLIRIYMRIFFFLYHMLLYNSNI